MSVPTPDRSRIPELSVRVFARTIHPDWFVVKAHQRISKDDWVADVRIIDRGHVVSWRSGNARLTEVVVRSADELPMDGIIYDTKVRGERAASLKPMQGIEYQASFDLEQSDPQIFAHLSDEIAKDGDQAHLFHAFESSSRLAPKEMSFVKVEARARGLLIHTFHTFHQERVIVRTQSLFETKLALPTY